MIPKLILAGRITSLATEKVVGFGDTLINEVVNSDNFTSIVISAGLVGLGAAALGVPKRRSGGSGKSGSALRALMK